jgi:lysozyme family protein
MFWVAVIHGTVSSIHTLDTIFHALELPHDFNIGGEGFAAIDFITTREHFERVIRYSRHTIL